MQDGLCNLAADARRETMVDDQEIEFLIPQTLAEGRRFGRAVGVEDSITGPGEREAHQIAHDRLVIDDKDCGHFLIPNVESRGR